MEVLGIEIDLAVIMQIIIKLALLTIVFLIITPIGKKLIQKAIQKTAQGKRTSPGRMKTLEKLLANVFSYVMIFIYIVMFFAKLGIEFVPIIVGEGVNDLYIAEGRYGIIIYMFYDWFL